MMPLHKTNWSTTRSTSCLLLMLLVHVFGLLPCTAAPIELRKATVGEINSGSHVNAYVGPDGLAGWNGNVLSQGVVADGATDTTVTLQRALNAGGEVLLPSGNYVVTNLYVTNNTHIRGAFGTTLIFKTGATNFIMSVGNNTNVQIENLTFDGGDRTTPGSLGTRNGLQMNLGTNGNSWVRYCQAIGFNGKGIQGTAPGGVLNGQLYGVGSVDHFTSKFCGYGLYQPEIGTDSAEYSQWSECEAVNCFEGVQKTAGNVVNIGHRISGCTTGIHLVGPGSNGNHGNWVGCTVNHCTTFVYAQSVATGEEFSGCILIAGGAIVLNQCNGVHFNGCQLSGPAPIVVTNSATGSQNGFVGNKFQGDWPLQMTVRTNDGGAFFFGNWGWNSGGLTNATDGSFGNPPYVVKPTKYALSTAQTTGTFSTANAPTPYFDIETIAWTASGVGGMGIYVPAADISPCTNSLLLVTVLNTNTATVTVTNVTEAHMYFGNSGRQYTSTIIYPTLQFPQGYTTYSLTNRITNSALKRICGTEFGQGNVNQNLYVTKIVEQPVQ